MSWKTTLSVSIVQEVAGSYDHPDSSNVVPETVAAERLRQHLEEIARERDRADRALQEREAELARIQRIARVGGLEIDFRDGVRNRRSPNISSFMDCRLMRPTRPTTIGSIDFIRRIASAPSIICSMR